jgi:cell division protein FtsQ
MQNNPILRIINSNGTQYYIDDEGNICNILRHKAANVLIANGDIKENLKGLQKIDSSQTPITYNIYTLTTIIRKVTILYNQIDQIYYVKNGTYELLPKVGDYVIKLGDMDKIDDKLIKLNNLYKEGFSEFGWDNYSEVKLEFEGQAVCVRK